MICRPGKSSIDAAIAEVTASMPDDFEVAAPGMTADPTFLSYNAANVPVLQLSVVGPKSPGRNSTNFATNFIRTKLATVASASIIIPLPYGGKTRAVSGGPRPRTSCKLTTSAPQEVATRSINKACRPSGTAKIGKREYERSDQWASTQTRFRH